ncbi:MAG: signal peptide peptidase SppA [Verrucomicrobiae bacterium]
MDAMPFTPTPPPPLSVPPLIAPPSAPKPRRSWGLIITCIILALLLGLAGLVIIGQFTAHSLSFNHNFKTASAREVGPKLEECLLEDNDSQNKIAVITVDGIISGHDYDQSGNNLVDVIQAQLDRAADDRHVKAVILKVDSPGGEVLASDDIYKAICAFQADEPDDHGKPGRKGKPVICSMGSLAASGGYYISSGCRWIVANELTITGSIGVIMHGYNYRGLMDKVGVAPMTFKSGKFKDMLSGEREPSEIPPEERAMVQGLIDETYEKFKGVVADGRTAAHELNKKLGAALADNWADYADGRVLSGKQALDLGLVDQLGDFDDTVDRALEIARLKSANLVEYRERYDLSNFLSLFGQSSQSHDIKLNLGVEAPKLQAGLMYFLYQP